MLSLHIITFPQGYVGALRSSLFNFDTHKGLTVKIYNILACPQHGLYTYLMLEEHLLNVKLGYLKR